MAKTDLDKQGYRSKDLTDRQAKFCEEYPKDHNATQAAIRAGYSPRGAAQTAAKLMKMTKVKAYIRKLEREAREGYRLERSDILEKVADNLHRDYRDLVDAEGYFKVNIRDIPERAHPWIDGFEVTQKILATDEDTGEPSIIEQKIKIKCSPNAAVQDMAMRHAGLYPKEEGKADVNVNITLDVALAVVLGAMEGRATIADDKWVESKVEETRQKALADMRKPK